MPPFETTTLLGACPPRRRPAEESIVLAARRTIAAHALGGAAFGCLVQLGDDGPALVAWTANIAGPWLCVAFVVGVVAPDRPSAARRASVFLVAGVVAKYALQLGEHRIATADALPRVLAWGAAALVVAATFAPAGRRARDGGHWPLLFLAASLELEATAFLFGGLRGPSAALRYHRQVPAIAVFVGELAVALACALEAWSRVSDAAHRSAIRPRNANRHLERRK